MSLEEGSGFMQDALSQLNDQIDSVHSELQASGAFHYPATSVDLMDERDRREIGEYLCRESGLDYGSSLYVIDQIGAIYREDEDRYIVTDALFDTQASSDEDALITHEAGHRFGRKIIAQRLMPVKRGLDDSPEALERLIDYFISENFAERVKVAAGETFNEDFTYNREFIDRPPEGYELRARIGPQEFVDPEREEDLELLLENVERLVEDTTRGL